jgi:hypothetical protein
VRADPLLKEGHCAARIKNCVDCLDSKHNAGRICATPLTSLSANVLTHRFHPLPATGQVILYVAIDYELLATCSDSCQPKLASLPLSLLPRASPPMCYYICH